METAIHYKPHLALNAGIPTKLNITLKNHHSTNQYIPDS